MTKEWVEQKNREGKAELAKERESIISAITNAKLLPQEKKEHVLNEFKDDDSEILADVELAVYGDLKGFDGEEEVKEFCDEMSDRIQVYKRKVAYPEYYLTYDKYLDSEPLEFDGDIIITDPSYVIIQDRYMDDWAKCECGYNMKALGFDPDRFMTRDTLYGDWECTVFDVDRHKPIGKFSADAGLVGVFYLDDVLAYNPQFDYHIKKPWTTTLIRDFKGTVQFVVKRYEGTYQETTKYHKEGDPFVDYDVEVIGKGTYKSTNEILNFVGKQTWF